MTIRTCLCLITRPADGIPASAVARARPAEAGAGPAGPGHPGDLELLLGFKKTGFGAGRWVGIGGHVEDGERPVDAAVREVAEESSLIVAPDGLTHMASLDFVFPFRPSWDQVAEVFVTTDFIGEPAESDELIPRWFGVGAIPFDGMWDDAKYWVPLVLSGERVTARISFAPDCATVAAIEPELPVLSRHSGGAEFQPT